MNEAIFIALMGITISCNELVEKPVVDFVWQKSICTQLSKDYSDIKLTPLKSSIVNNKNTLIDEDKIPRIASFKAGRLKVTVNEISKNNTVDEVTYLVNVEAYKNVWIMVRSMKSGRVLQEKDVFKSSINVAPFIGIKNFVDEIPVGKKLKVAQKKSSVLFIDSLEAPDLITIGDKLTAKIVDGNMSIETYALALESGNKKGQTIKVRLLATGATFQATIKGSKNVEISI